MGYRPTHCARCGCKIWRGDEVCKQLIRVEGTGFISWTGNYICCDCIERMSQRALIKEFALTKDDVVNAIREMIHLNSSEFFGVDESDESGGDENEV